MSNLVHLFLICNYLFDVEKKLNGLMLIPLQMERIKNTYYYWCHVQCMISHFALSEVNRSFHFSVRVQLIHLMWLEAAALYTCSKMACIVFRDSAKLLCISRNNYTPSLSVLLCSNEKNWFQLCKLKVVQ